jgi:hypothetical protein
LGQVCDQKHIINHGTVTHEHAVTKSFVGQSEDYGNGSSILKRFRAPEKEVPTKNYLNLYGVRAYSFQNSRETSTLYFSNLPTSGMNEPGKGFDKDTTQDTSDNGKG